MMRTRLLVAGLCAAAVGIVSAQQPPANTPDAPDVTRMIERLRRDAGPRFAYAVHFWCEEPRANRPDDPPIPATKIFDEVYAIGNSGTTVYVIRTSQGLLMIDALGAGDAAGTTAQLESQLLPGLQKLGLDPAQIKVVLVTHGHADHYGGAAYFQERYGSKVYVSTADWAVMENPPARGRGGRGPAGPPTPLPKHDAELHDGDLVTLGDLKIKAIAVPGHTPGSMGFIFPVHDNGKAHVAALFGGAWLTPQILSDDALQTFRMSVAHFVSATRDAKVDVLLQNHMLMDPIQPKLDAIAARAKGQPNPFVVGRSEYQKFLTVMDGCTQVNLQRRGVASRAAAITQSAPAELQLVARAAEALGGRDRVMALKTLQIVGFGELAYMDGGGNITGDPAAPQKWQKVLEYKRTIDLEHGRTRVEQRVKMDFPFASTAGQLGLNRSSETLDGDVAFNIGGGFLAAPQSGTPQPQAAGAAAARQRRVELLAHPITIVRAALDPSSKLSNLRKQGSLQLVDVTVREGDTLTLAVNSTSGLPEWVSYVGPQVNLGDVTYRTAFSGYEPEKGVQLPTAFATTIDWRNVVHSKLDVDRNIVDAPVDDLSAPAAVRAPRPAQGGGAANLEPVKVADHVWFMNGNSFFEFDDHLTMMEANRQDAPLQAILKIANALVPGKRVTQVIQSHHHFDHTVGLRAAVAEDLTVISRRGNEGIFREMTSRPAKLFPDALGRNPKPLKFIAVDDHLKLKDSTNEVDIYHIVGNYHMADGVIVHVPAARVLVEADQTTQNWDFNWWADSLMNNVEYRNLKVDTVLAVHGQQPVPLAEVVSAIERQVRNTQAFCRRAAEAQFFQPGCPVHYNRPLPASKD